MVSREASACESEFASPASEEGLGERRTERVRHDGIEVYAGLAVPVGGGEQLRPDEVLIWVGRGLGCDVAGLAERTLSTGFWDWI